MGNGKPTPRLLAIKCEEEQIDEAGLRLVIF
jgi:hypothetical protein